MASSIDSIYNPSGLVPSHEAHKPNAAVCYCPACLGLQCLERPRYFAGQLLTEAELNSEQAYVIAKNKLHNRYLHGWGVVCGLQVVCHECDGWVTVKQGYAIDPCGNDIIVCDDQDFDVIKAIRDCRDGRRRRRRADCDPIAPPDDKSCKDVEEHWCITIEYEEKEARPTTALRPEKKAKYGCGCGSSCGCGCGGNGNGKKKSCGCNCQSGKGQTTSTQGGTGKTTAQCEPTRVFEQFRLNVVEEPKYCGSTKFTSNLNTQRVRSQLGGYMTAFGLGNSQQTLVSQVLGALPQDSMLIRIINCLTGLGDFIQARLTDEDLLLLLRILPTCICRDRSGVYQQAGVVGAHSHAAPEGSVAPTAGAGDTREEEERRAFALAATGNLGADLYALCCRLHRLVSDLYTENPFNVRCDYGCPPCPPPPPPQDNDGESGPEITYSPYRDPLAESICCSVDRVIQYAFDCICQAFLPPCPSNPDDDRIILACVTIKNNKIVDICNFGCRHYAGSFPAVNYWLSLVPIIPLLSKGIQQFCCNPNLLNTLCGLFEARTEQRRGLSRNMGDRVRDFLRDRFSFENIAEALRNRKRVVPQSELDELRKQVEALRLEMETLKRGEHG